MERKIGEIFKFDNENYKVVEHDGCAGCAFIESKYCLSGKLGKCGSMSRNDWKNVIFKKLLCNMKEFNLEEAKAGKPVCTRDGHEVRILCYDAKGGDDIRIVALIDINGVETPMSYYKDGKVFRDTRVYIE